MNKNQFWNQIGFDYFIPIDSSQRVDELRPKDYHDCIKDGHVMTVL